MGSRGSSSGGGGSSLGSGGGGGATQILSTESLWSEAGKRPEILQTGQVLKDIADKYGLNVNDALVATLGGADAWGTQAYYDADGNIAINKNFFDTDIMNKSYDKSVERKWHPGRGNKSGIEATAAHEMGHALNLKIAGSWDKMNRAASRIVARATKDAGYGKDQKSFAKKISGYATSSWKECIAEAFSDVYCNGKKASKESRALVDVVNNMLGVKGY